MQRLSEGLSRRELFAAAAAIALTEPAGGAPGLAGGRAAPTAASAPREPALRAIDRYVSRHVEERGAPGLVLALADADGWRRVSSTGTDPVDGKQLDTAALFQIGSLSKAFLAIAAIQAAEEGILDLDEPIRDRLPWLRVDSVYQPITAHHLLTHTSGLPRDTPMLPCDPARPLWTSHAPGSAFSYSNLGFDLLGKLLGAVEGEPLSTILRRRVLEPLGMSDSEPILRGGIRGRFPPSYTPLYDDRPLPRHGPLTRAAPVTSDGGAGCVAATAADMCRFLQALLRGGALERGRLLSEKGFERMTRAWIPMGGGARLAYGYGVVVDRSRERAPNRPILRHTGGMVSFSSAMWIDLATGLAAFAAVPANLFGYRPLGPAAWAADCLAAGSTGEPLPAPPPSDDPFRLDNAGDYAGVFSDAAGGRLAFGQDGDGLVVGVGGSTKPLQRLAPDVFLADHPELALHPLEFGRRDGEVVEVWHGGRWLVNGRYRGPTRFEHPEAWQGLVGVYRNDSPWEGTLKVFLRKGQLWLWPRPLVPLGDGLFRVGGEETSTERVRFDGLADGRALRLFLSEREYRRIEE